MGPMRMPSHISSLLCTSQLMSIFCCCCITQAGRTATLQGEVQGSSSSRIRFTSASMLQSAESSRVVTGAFDGTTAPGAAFNSAPWGWQPALGWLATALVQDQQQVAEGDRGRIKHTPCHRLTEKKQGVCFPDWFAFGETISTV